MRYNRRRKILIIIITAIIVILVLGFVRRARKGDSFFNPPSKTSPTSDFPAPNPIAEPIPEAFKDLYSKLETELQTFENKIDKQWNGTKHPVKFSAGLITANSNIGENLLRQDIYDLSLKLLDRLEELGVKAIALDINYPLLAKSFHKDQTQYQQYLDFYKKLSSEIKNRGLAISIESNTIFPDFSPLPVKDYFSNLTLDSYKKDKAEMLVTIAKELKPDYLSFGNEPDTAAYNTGLPLNNPDTYTETTRFYLEEMNKAGITGIKLGDGFGTWQRDYKDWAEKMTAIPDLDFLNIHIYAIDEGRLDRALEISDMAKQNGKTVAIHETWLNKWQESEGKIGIKNIDQVYIRDNYSFFQPLDQKFLAVLVKLAHYKQFEYLNPFWTQYLFTYLDYENVKNLSYRETKRETNQQFIKNIQKGGFSPTGLYYKQLITTP